MLKLITKSLLIAVFIVLPVFADEELSTFNQQGDVSYPEPISEDNYFAEKAPMPSTMAKYLGVNIGLGVIDLKPTFTETKTKYDKSQSKVAFNYGGGVYGGLGTNFNRFYIGTELSLGYNFLNKIFSDSDKAKNIDNKITVKQNIVGGIDIIPGYLTEARDMLFYGRLGVGAGLFKLSFDDNINKNIDSTSKVSIGMRAGLGFEYFFSDSFSIRTEYIYTRYNKINCNYTKSPPYEYTYKLDASGEHRVNLGMAMHF